MGVPKGLGGLKLGWGRARGALAGAVEKAAAAPPLAGAVLAKAAAAKPAPPAPPAPPEEDGGGSDSSEGEASPASPDLRPDQLAELKAMGGW